MESSQQNFVLQMYLNNNRKWCMTVSNAAKHFYFSSRSNFIAKWQNNLFNIDVHLLMATLTGNFLNNFWQMLLYLYIKLLKLQWKVISSNYMFLHSQSGDKNALLLLFTFLLQPSGLKHRNDTHAGPIHCCASLSRTIYGK